MSQLFSARLYIKIASYPQQQQQLKDAIKEQTNKIELWNNIKIEM